MGHVRLGSLPKTRKWQQVTDLLGGDADIGEIAAASSDAAENSLGRAANDPAFRPLILAADPNSARRARGELRRPATPIGTERR